MKTPFRFLVVILSIAIVVMLTISNFSSISYINRPHGIPPKPTEMKLTTRLYFVNDDKLLEAETRTITVKENNFVTAIIDELKMGPRDEHLYTVLDDNIVVNDASIVDKKCVVDLAIDVTYSSFFKYGYIDQMVWSMVNSLTELNNIDKVQITVNGQEIQTYQPAFMYYGTLTRNERLIYLRPKPPADVVLTFLDYLTTERFDMAYDLISFQSKQKLEFTEFVDRMIHYNKTNVGYQRSIYFTQSYSTGLVIFIKYISTDIDEMGNRVSKNEQWELVEEDGTYKVLVQ